MQQDTVDPAEYRGRDGDSEGERERGHQGKFRIRDEELEAEAEILTQNQLPYLQLVTWNDYEEGTEMESGIDNCFSLNASLSGSTLEWTINGDESTIDHYAVYASPDGNTLQQIAQVQPGTYSVNLCSAGVPTGTTQVFVQAVGKPSMANRMPGPVAYGGGCS